MELQAQRAGGMPLGGYAAPSCSCFIRMILEHSEGCPSPGIGKTWKLQTCKAVSVHLLYMSARVATFTFSEQVLPEPVINFLLVTSSASVVSSVPLQDDFYFWNTQTDETTWDIEARGPRLGLPRLHSDYCTGWANVSGSFQPI